MFVRKYVVPLLAVLGIAFAVRTVLSQNQPIVPAKPVTEPAVSPWEANVAGAGIIEASTRNIAIGTHVAGVVAEVMVKENDRVRAGDPLFRIDDRRARSELAVREASLMAARKQLEKLQAMPRPEEVPVAESKVTEQKALLADAQAQLDRFESVTDKRAITEDELIRRRFAVMTWKSRVEEAESDLRLLKAGAWSPDLDVARANVQSAQAQVDSARTELDLLTVKSPVAGTILQVNTRAGEYAQAGPLTMPLLVVGDTDTLHVRIDVDENDAYRIQQGAKAVASLRGNSAIKTDLTFVRVDPYVIPKRSLTGDSAERVDTRVLQVIYSFKSGVIPAFVGQQVDVKIDAPTRTTATPPGKAAIKTGGPL